MDQRRVVHTHTRRLVRKANREVQRTEWISYEHLVGARVCRSGRPRTSTGARVCRSGRTPTGARVCRSGRPRMPNGSQRLQ